MRGTREVLAGRNPVREALRAGRRRIAQVMLADGVEQRGIIADILSLCRQAQVPIRSVPRAELERQAGGGVEHQGVLAQVSAYPYVALDELLSAARAHPEPPLFLVLDALQDPQNVGSVLRTAEAVGVHGVILPERRAVGITPAVSRASAGAVEHLCVAQVTNLARTLGLLKEAGLWCVGLEDCPEAQDYRQADLTRPLALVLGSEGVGLHRLVADTCDFLVRIPMRGQINSLNASVAGALVLYEAWRARGMGDGD